ncbi:type VI secretion protein [Terasakiispira papahanaumokuakeensis]|uniref:Type VI secretion protein n=1 Tax=Terasakiispira papahanaumokuakeensis TaxID=197479 RepID=A0A1E2V813_9GAMM|nr:type VI secretion system baseplate subunit TssE [Terasakiispira papahanaumokuakeensis]ODC03121.1 type VI secretion protein [Terasakiispira papahanaumokuakeensis]
MSLSHRQMVPSLLDRLIDDMPQQPHDPTPGHRCSVDHYRSSVVRDLEMLVNTRRDLLAYQLDAFPSLQGSVLEYGLPDFTSRGLHSSVDRHRIQRELERTIECGDNRFRSVHVQLVDVDRGDRIVQFRIEALLVLHESSEFVAFDAVLQTSTRQYKVQKLR